VDFELSDEQVALRGAARDLLAGASPMPVVRAVVDAGGGWDRPLWAAMVDQGWTGIAVDESLGGLGLGWVEAAILAEAAGEFVAPAPIVDQLIALDSLASSSWGAGVLDGSAIACVAASGTAEVVPFAPSADVVVAVDAGAATGPARLVAAPLAAPRPPGEPAMDLTREVGWIDPATLVDAAELGGPDAVARHVDVGATLYAAELLGLSARMLDTTVEYAKDRVQFDRPIGSFQAVKHRCADMLVDVEGMRSAVYWAAWCLGAGDPDTSIAASTAKAWCSDAARRVMASALQVHGGIGFTWESDVHLYLKRAQLDAMRFGDATFHRARLAGFLRAKVAAGTSVI
jgi:alkylation response protein AidB-like acyl-CoA dehydrogenase